MRKIVESNSTDPYFNLALEEYLFHCCKPEDEMLYLWQNDHTVVIGRNQNPWKECNLDALEKTNCKLARRRSGGGAVYHDLGNLNFTFISGFESDRVEKNINLMIQVLRGNGVKAFFNGKNDIQVGGLKVSGNAYYTENNMLCHHGTLLVNSEIIRMEELLIVSQPKLVSKGIDSVRSRMINLAELNPDITVNVMKTALQNAFWNQKRSDNNRNQSAVFDKDITKISKATKDVPDFDLYEVHRLAEYYAGWDWNFGSSPEFNIKLFRRYSQCEVELYLVVQNGIIKNAHISTDSLDLDLPARIKKKILDFAFNEKELLTVTLPRIIEYEET